MFSLNKVFIDRYECTAVRGTNSVTMNGTDAMPDLCSVEPLHANLTGRCKCNIYILLIVFDKLISPSVHS